MQGYFYIMAAVAVWGVEYVLIKAVAAQSGPLFMGFVMFGTAAVGLALTCLFKKRSEETVLAAAFPYMLIVGLIGTGCNVLWLYGASYTSTANASVLGRTDILFTLLLSCLVFHEKIRKTALLFIPLMLVGVFIVTGADIKGISVSGKGDFLILCSTFLLSLNAFIIKKYVRNISGKLLALGNCMLNTLAFGILLAVNGLPAGASISITTVLLSLLGGCCSLIFFIGYYAALKELPVWKIRIFCLAVPLISAISGYVFIGEIISSKCIIGMAMIVAGAAGIFLSENNKIMSMILNKYNEVSHVEL